MFKFTFLFCHRNLYLFDMASLPILSTFNWKKAQIYLYYLYIHVNAIANGFFHVKPTLWDWHFYLIFFEYFTLHMIHDNFLSRQKKGLCLFCPSKEGLFVSLLGFFFCFYREEACKAVFLKRACRGSGNGRSGWGPLVPNEIIRPG